jgi:peptide-methionine (S)-S-oxide reductase
MKVIPMTHEKATFAAGCFWGVEDIFMNLPGVISTRVGYVGGHTENPTYKDVCTDSTGHAEAVEVEFDPEQVSYETLLEKFWAIHDPTTLNRQGPNVGSQYRSAVFFHTPQQGATAQLVKDRLAATKDYPGPIVTEIVEAEPFYEAEEHHQKYNQKHGRHCGVFQ